MTRAIAEPEPVDVPLGQAPLSGTNDGIPHPLRAGFRCPNVLKLNNFWD
jgi:hypothetical protein